MLALSLAPSLSLSDPFNLRVFLLTLVTKSGALKNGEFAVGGVRGGWKHVMQGFVFF